MRSHLAVVPRVAFAVALAVVSSAAASGTATASTPPDEPTPDESAPDDSAVGDPPIGPGSPDFERQLAEIAFGQFLAADDEFAATAIDGSLACSEPPDPVDGAITCFYLADGTVTAATTTASDGSGSFEFELVTIEPDEEPVDPELRRAADERIAEQAELVNLDVERFTNDYEEESAIESVDRYGFDTESATLIIEFTLVADIGFAIDDAAWVNTQEFAGYYWTDGGAFRAPDATAPPRLRLTINGQTWESDHDLMVAVADADVDKDEWLGRVTTDPAPDDSTP